MPDYNDCNYVPWYSRRYEIKKVVIENGVTNIGRYAFQDCSNLASVNIPNSVTSIGKESFSRCSGLTSITIPNSVTNIGEQAFYYCSGLTSINIPNSVTSIGEMAFYYCSGLTSITIPNSVNSIRSSAFAGCSGLTSITIPNSVTNIEYMAFGRCYGLTSITIPNSVTSIGIGAFSGTKWYYNQSDGLIYAGLVLYTCKGTIPTKIDIKDGTKGIAGYAFELCSNVTSITIPKSVTNIGSYAFIHCIGLTSITCEAPTPPNCNSNCFDDVDKSIPIYVPANSVETYKATKEWKNFTNIQAIPTYHTVTLDPNKGIGNSEQITVTYNQPMPENIGLIAPIRTGYDFCGYTIGETYYYDANLKSVHKFDKQEDYTLYANWKAHTTTVNLDFQGGMNGTSLVTATYDDLMPTSNDIIAPTRDGYTFVGYYDSADGNGNQYYNADMTSNSSWNKDVSEITLYAKWDVIPVTDISLSEVAASLWVGETKEISATAIPTTAYNTTVNWTSSNNNVATVSYEGVITAIEKGTCIITCTAADGYGTTSTCEVTVKQPVTAIALSDAIVSLWVGETKELSATATPTTANATTVGWSSSDDKVASVSSDGVITANGEGTCTITCTAADGYGTTSTCEVTVKQQVTEITLNETIVSLWVGDTKTITATVAPITANNTAVEWSSSDDNVATVSSEGVITAKGQGGCTITCTAADGYGTTSTCEVTVKQQVTEITLNETIVSLWVGDTKTIKATVSPTTASNTAVEWSSSDDNIVTVSADGVITANDEGTCIITCTAADGYGTTSICEVTVMQRTTGIEDLQIPKDESPVYYNLSGQRINKSHAQKGIYIKNGKKYAK